MDGAIKHDDTGPGITGYHDLKRAGDNYQNSVSSPKKKKIEFENLIVYANDDHRALTIQKTKDLNPEFKMDFFESTSTTVKNKQNSFEKTFEFKIDGHVIGVGRGFSKKAAKQQCIQDADRNLRKIGKVVPFNTKPSVHKKKSAFSRQKMGSPPTSSVVEVPAPDLADAQKENDQCFVGLDIEDLAGLEFTHVQDTPISHSLSNFAKNNGLKFETQVYEVKKESSKPSDWGTRVLFNGTEISAAVSSSKKAAKSACWTSAFSVLRKRCDYVERKGRRDNFEVVVQEFKSHDQQETENKTNSRSHEESDLDSSFEIQDFLQESSPAKPSPVKTRLKLEDQVIFYRSGLLDEKSKLQTLPKEIEKPVYLQFNNTQPATSHNFGPMKEHIDSIQRIKRRLKGISAILTNYMKFNLQILGKVRLIAPIKLPGEKG